MTEPSVLAFLPTMMLVQDSVMRSCWSWALMFTVRAIMRMAIVKKDFIFSRFLFLVRAKVVNFLDIDDIEGALLHY